MIQRKLLDALAEFQTVPSGNASNCHTVAELAV
jgi:hypothetical protein